jgi:hypothetical protein
MPDTIIPSANAGDHPARTLDERIAAMEAALPRSNIAGTTLSRVLHEKQGIEWCLALGPMQLPKTFFRGPTIESVVAQGELAVANMQNGRLDTDWDKLDLVLGAPRAGS